MKRLVILLLSLLLLIGTATAESATTSLQEMYAQAELLMVQGDYVGAAAKFEALSAYSDAAQMTLYCKAIYAADMGMYEMAVDALSSMGQFKDAPQLARYYTACSFLNCAETGNFMQMVDYEKYMQLWSDDLVKNFKDPSYEIVPWNLVCCYWAKAIFTELALYKDSLMKISECDTLILKHAAQEEAEREKKYQDALEKENTKNYQAAADLYFLLEDYKDSKSRYAVCIAEIEKAKELEKLDNAYQAGLSLMEKEKYSEAHEIFLSISGFMNSAELAQECSSLYCSKVEELFSNRKEYESLAMYSYHDDYHWNLSFQQNLSSFIKPKLSGGVDYTVGVTPGGNVVFKGHSYQESGNVNNWQNIVAISASNHTTIGLKENGTVVATGSNTYGQCNVDSWTDIVAISMGLHHTVGLKSDGTVVATGYNDYGGCDVQDWNDIIAISAGSTHTLGLKSDGTVVAAGVNGAGQYSVEEWHDIVAIAAGSGFSIGLKSDGTVISTGRNKEGQCNVEQWNNIISIATCHYCTVGLKNDGSVVMAGDSYFGSITEWSNIAAIGTGTMHIIGMKTDGTLVAVGNNDWSECELQDLNLLD